MKKICNSFIDFIRYIEEADEIYTKNNPNNILLFRGHSNFNFSLLPSAFRNDESNEFSDCHNIEIEYPEEFNKFDHLSNLVKMQHYGVKTRLLDLTLNPLVALYFAACENQDVDGEVLVFKCKKEEIKHHSSDTILCLSCIPFLTNVDQSNLLRYCNANKGRILGIGDYYNSIAVHHLYHEIRSQYPTFEYEIRVNDLLKTYFVAANKDNARMKAQDGLFAIYGLDKNEGENWINKQIVSNIIISKRCKKDIIKSLNKYGINDSKVYLGLDRAAINLYGKYLKVESINK